MNGPEPGRGPGSEHGPRAEHGEARPQSVLEIRSLRKSYGDTLALDGVDFEVRQGELVTLLGPSGSGKTTLLKVIAGFEAPDSGTISLRARDISRLPPARRGIGMVFQHYALFPHMTVAQNVGYGLRVRRVAREERERRVAAMLELLRLGGLERRYPRQLSGGQQQRVALGRALAYDPQIILMDEPLGALDRALRVEMEQEIRDLHRTLRATIVYVTHDQQEALALSDRIAIVRDGQIVGMDSPERLHTHPPNGFVARFFSEANLLPVEGVEPLERGRARVRCAGSHLECEAMPGAVRDGEPDRDASAAAMLAVRPHSLRRAEAASTGLRLAGKVLELTLLGDERQLAVEVAGVGRVLAVLAARDCRDLSVGEGIALLAPCDELVLVGE